MPDTKHTKKPLAETTFAEEPIDIKALQQSIDLLTRILNLSNQINKQNDEINNQNKSTSLLKDPTGAQNLKQLHDNLSELLSINHDLLQHIIREKVRSGYFLRDIGFQAVDNFLNNNTPIRNVFLNHTTDKKGNIRYQPIDQTILNEIKKIIEEDTKIISAEAKKQQITLQQQNAKKGNVRARRRNPKQHRKQTANRNPSTTRASRRSTQHRHNDYRGTPIYWIFLFFISIMIWNILKRIPFASDYETPHVDKSKQADTAAAKATDVTTLPETFVPLVNPDELFASTFNLTASRDQGISSTYAPSTLTTAAAFSHKTTRAHLVRFQPPFTDAMLLVLRQPAFQSIIFKTVVDGLFDVCAIEMDYQLQKVELGQQQIKATYGEPVSVTFYLYPSDQDICPTPELHTFIWHFLYRLHQQLIDDPNSLLDQTTYTGAMGFNTDINQVQLFDSKLAADTTVHNHTIEVYCDKNGSKTKIANAAGLWQSLATETVVTQARPAATAPTP